MLMVHQPWRLLLIVGLMSWLGLARDFYGIDLASPAPGYFVYSVDALNTDYVFISVFSPKLDLHLLICKMDQIVIFFHITGS